MFIMFIIPTPVQISRRHYVFYLLSGRLSSVTKFVNAIFKKNELTYFDANWHDTINFGDQEITRSQKAEVRFGGLAEASF